MRRYASKGFTLIEIAIAIVVLMVAAVPIVRLMGPVLKNGMSTERTVSEMNNNLVMINNMVAQIQAGSFTDVAAELATLADEPGGIEQINGSYTEGPNTLYYTLSVLNNSYLIDGDGSPIKYDGTAAASGQEKRMVPHENTQFAATLAVFADAARTQPITAVSFFFGDTDCTVPEYCEPGDETGETTVETSSMDHSSLYFMYDVSGSMSATGSSGVNRLEEVKLSMLSLLTAMEADSDIAANIKVGSGKFNHTAAHLTNLELAMPTYALARPQLTPNTPLFPSGGTAINTAIDTAASQLQPDAWAVPGQKIAVILSDGGSSQAAAETSAANALSNGVKVYTISFYQGCNAVMQGVADNGGGQCYAAQNATDLLNAFTAIVSTTTTAGSQSNWLEGKLCRHGQINNPSCVHNPGN